MWKFWQKLPLTIPLSDTVRLLLAKERGVSEASAATLRMIEERGHYSDRAVTYFRAFGPGTAARAGSEILRSNDLDKALILHAWHIEPAGAIVLNQQPRPS
jgi:hypothetical protein